MMQRPFLVVGIAAVVAVILAVIVAFATGRGGGSGPSVTSISPTQRGTPTPSGTGTPKAEIKAKARSVANVRLEPNGEVIGNLAEGQEVTVVARSRDEGWFQIVYPLGSSRRGWVAADLLQIEGDLSLVPPAGPEATATPEATSSPTATATAAATATSVSATATSAPATAVPAQTATQAPTARPPLAGPPDLVPIAFRSVGGRLSVDVQNFGPGTISNRDIEIGVFMGNCSTPITGTTLALVAIHVVSMPPTAPDNVVSILTPYSVTSGQIVCVTVDPRNLIEEASKTNNSRPGTVP